ncbi:MAG TPA: twin-arginine translocase TatA/TatE family subunit [Candidatus Bathyarchaeota archaeon]|nr:twin-arginine translocase TatA/TatE family subunit [Candidatus Bathyarchaeota archaeon]
MVRLEMLGSYEIIAILAIALLLLGPKKLPELARGVGKAIYEYRKASQGLFEEEEKPAKKDEREMLIEAATKMGIETEGRDIKEIAREVLEKVEGKDS